MKKNDLFRASLCLFFLVVQSGCLATRAELREGGEPKRTQVSAAQEKQAQTLARFDDYDSQFRQMNGRIDQIENQLNQIDAANASRSQQEQKLRDDMDRRFKVYEEALTRLDSQVNALSEEIKNLQSKPQAKAEVVTPKGGSFQAAEAAFDSKDWRSAILEYENYRKENPKGKNLALATYKIGVSFQELGKKEEAKVFYEEVVAKFPGSKDAKKASQRLKSMK